MPEGARVLITGAASGIGAARVAGSCAREGYFDRSSLAREFVERVRGLARC